MDPEDEVIQVEIDTDAYGYVERSANPSTTQTR